MASRELECSLCSVLMIPSEALLFFLTRAYKKEHPALFIWFSLSLSLLFICLFVLEMCAEDEEGRLANSVQKIKFWPAVDKCQSRGSVLPF